MKISKYSAKKNNPKSVGRLNFYFTPDERSKFIEKYGEKFSLDMSLTIPRALVLRPDSGGARFGNSVLDGHTCLGWSDHRLGDLVYKIPDMAKTSVESWTFGPTGVTIIWPAVVQKPKTMNRRSKVVIESTQNISELFGRIGACATQLQELLNQVPPNDEINITWTEGRLGITMTERKIKKLF